MADTMNNEFQNDPYNQPPPIWRAIQELIVEREKIGVRMDTIEESFLGHVSLHNGITRALEEINRKLETNGAVLIEMKAGLDEQKREVTNLWNFPRNSLTIISLLSGVIYGFYKLWGWVIHAGDIRMPK
jgi:hypothetical protein